MSPRTLRDTTCRAALPRRVLYSACFGALFFCILGSAGRAYAQVDTRSERIPVEKDAPVPADTLLPGQSDKEAHPVDSAAENVEEPYRFVQLGTTTRVPNPAYDAGGLRSWFFGDEYRCLWTMPLDVPIIDLEHTAGGLTPIERGGGMQTTSLHLEGGDGHFYVLRSVDKDAQRSLPEGFRGTFIGSIAQDQIASLHPLGAQLVPHLARAAGVLHAEPTLVIIPDSPFLGEFREGFAGLLAQFERKPDEDQSEAARFGFSENIVGTEKMFEDSRADNDERVDQRAYARARLFDMLLGDWDRHDEQWRWAEFETEDGLRFVAVPKDRDFAFVKFDGLMNRLGRLSGNMMLRRLGDFDGDIHDVLGLNWQGSKLDRQLTPSLTREDWVGIADSLRAALTDDVIDDAVRTWPHPVVEQIGPITARSLKARRDQLPSAASQYYDLLAQTVDIVGTDKHERFEITRLTDDETQVVMLKTRQEGDVVRELSRRVFHHDETDEIRLYGLGGNDQFVIDGEAGDALRIRMIGGDGDDAFVDSSTVDAPARLTRFYDARENTSIDAGDASRLHLSSDPRVNSYEPMRFELNTVTPQISLDYNSDDGLFMGGGARLVRSGFRKDPYAARHLITLNYAPRSRAYNAYYDGRLISVWNGFDARVEIEALAARSFRNFYGLGNETLRGDRSRFLARLRTVTALPSLRRQIGGRSYFEFGPRAEYISVDPPAGLSAGDPGVGFTEEQLVDAYLAGFQTTIALDGRDSTMNPQSGFFWMASTSFQTGLRTTDYRFGRLTSDLRVYYTLPLVSQITLALRAGGATNVGSFPFFDASTLGSRENLRGYPGSRFAGRSAVFTNAELRAKVLDFNVYLLKGELGILGFSDYGRVWADDEDSGLWHHGYGGGLWMTPFNMSVFTASIGASEEGTLLDLSIGFQF